MAYSQTYSSRNRNVSSLLVSQLHLALVISKYILTLVCISTHMETCLILPNSYVQQHSYTIGQSDHALAMNILFVSKFLTF